MAAIEHEELASQLASEAPDLGEVLAQYLPSAVRVLSSAGVLVYLSGARSLWGLGRGTDLVETYLASAPKVAADCDEEILVDLVSAVMRLSSLTSTAVLVEVISTLPVVASRVQDAELLRSYLAFVHQLGATAPRALRPALSHLDELLAKLTIGGLRRWAEFGTQAYRRDYDNLVAYFDLRLADSRAVLDGERDGVLFVDAQRRLRAYLRALWGRDFPMRPIEADLFETRSFVEGGLLHIPDVMQGGDGRAGLDHYRATIAHLASHLQYHNAPADSGGLSQIQRYLVGFVEDARVERLAVNDFPGLRPLWLGLMASPKEDGAKPGLADAHSALSGLQQLGRQLLDEGLQCGHSELAQFAQRFHAEAPSSDSDPLFARSLGLELSSLLSRHWATPSRSQLDQNTPSYRDDNRVVWASPNREDVNDARTALAGPQVRYGVSPMMMAHALDSELAGDDAQEIWTCTDRMRVYEDDLRDTALTFNELIGSSKHLVPVYYQEWDYLAQRYRPDWTTVFERRALLGDAGLVDQILLDHKGIALQISHLVERLSPAGMQRHRGLEDGDWIDLAAGVDALIALRSGQSPDMRIMRRNVINTRSLAVVVLLDLSESANEVVAGTGKTVLELTREAAVLVATAIDGVGDSFAIHGFASDGRHDVQYTRFKDFEEPFGAAAKSRLAGMTAGLSTRMGAALRHCGAGLARRVERKKLVLLVTDGQPADVDEADQRHLRQDTKVAVEELRAQGISAFCLTLDPLADNYVAELFGPNSYTVIDRVERLPEKLPRLFGRLTS